ncbi:hypothetical protein [Nostoc sp.]|uniref:hypothetical protein n=1 Tax=Nostoc sp. TaxID=1180 RepID=UPI002FFA8302
MTTTLKTKHLPTNRPITLNKTLTIDGINTPKHQGSQEKNFNFTTVFLELMQF